MKQTKKIVDNLEGIKNKLAEESEKRNQRYEETKKQLESIKNMLQERVNEEEQKRQRELELESLKLQEQEAKRKKKAKKGVKRGEGERERKVKLKKLGDI